MEKNPPSFCEYETIPKSIFLKINESYYDENDWNELCRYAILLSEWAKKGDVEEKPGPDGDNLSFGGFIGSYKLTSNKKLDIKVNKNKLTKREYDLILNEVIEWCYILGPNFYSQFNFTNPLYPFENILGYSNHLIDLTELALSSYLSPIIEKVTKISPTVHGRINIPRTVRHLIQSQALVVSIKTKLQTDTLPILLLIRFNYEISRGIRGYLARLDNLVNVSEYQVRTSFEDTLRRNMSYHQGFLLNPRNRRLIQRSFEPDFHDPEVLNETINQSIGNSIFNDLVLLWEGYSSNRSLSVSLENFFRGDNNLKPISKIYELWVLKKIIEILSAFYSKPQLQVRDEGIIFIFKKEDYKIEVFYTYNINEFNMFDKPPSELKPDYLIKYSNEKEKIVLVLDAKYKPRVKSSDVQQLITYMLVTGWKDMFDKMYGALLYVGSGEVKPDTQKYVRETPDAEIFKICIRPNFEAGLDALKILLSNAIKFARAS